ncbi:NAD(P)-binding protein [Mycena chlorophos]|uniref:NAD(P)-binding protein n=1 Tax=Mycena chlorophos TaxID=658473 RepID=A0A8H6TH10_MYCCL|nr:NAD(P)-binding protein [Mycena chlorophos]
MLPTFSSKTTAQEVADALVDEIRGKNVLITGTSQNGIGFEAARVISQYASLVIITGYDAERLQLAEDAIKQNVPEARIRRLRLDLSSLNAVRQAAAEVNAYSEPLHVVIHNAAAPIGDFNLTVDNLESQLAVGHVGPFVFTKLIAPKLLSNTSSTSPPRVVFLSSAGHSAGLRVDLDFLKNPRPERSSAYATYAQTKSAAVLMAAELSRRSHGKINAYSLHPGTIFTNIFTKGDGPRIGKGAGMLDATGQPSPAFGGWKSIPQGASTILVAAFDPRLGDSPGAYLNDCAISTKHVGHEAEAATLWTTTEEIIGEKFEFA